MELFDEGRQGMVLRVEKSSIHDGDGFRTVVFLKGCPLRCQWCSTPESQCFDIENAGDKTYGKVMTVKDVIREVRKDSLFYFLSKGGLTISGGECLSQPEFTLAVLKNARAECFNTAIETSFFAPWEAVEEILPYVNTALIDLKIFDNELHKKYCGVENTLILQNIIKADSLENKTRLVIRIPIIPGINDTAEDLNNMGEFCGSLKKLEYVQLLPYHNLGTETYKKLGRQYQLPNVAAPTEESMEGYREILRRYNITVR